MERVVPMWFLPCSRLFPTSIPHSRFSANMPVTLPKEVGPLTPLLFLVVIATGGPRKKNLNDSHRNFLNLWEEKLLGSIVLNTFSSSSSLFSLSVAEWWWKLFMFVSERETGRRRKLFNWNWNIGITVRGSSLLRMWLDPISVFKFLEF